MTVIILRQCFLAFIPYIFRIVMKSSITIEQQGDKIKGEEYIQSEIEGWLILSRALEVDLLWDCSSIRMQTH